MRLQSIAALEAQLERQDVRGTALRAAIAKLTEYAKDANEKAATADKDLLDLDHELTILQANVRRFCDWRAVVVLPLRVEQGGICTQSCSLDCTTLWKQGLEARS